MAHFPAAKRTTLLCVDSNPVTPNSYEQLLSLQGYEVLSAAAGQQAVELFRSRSKDIDAVISDFQIRGMNGAELAAELKRRKPSLPVIMISRSESVLEDAQHFVDGAVAKGIPVENMVKQINVLLDSWPAHKTKTSPYTALGSAVAGVAAGAFLLAKIWR